MDLLARACTLLLISSAAAAAPVYTQTYDADFTSTDHLDTTNSDSGVWNTVEGRLRADMTSNGVDLSFGGDGSDGAFSDGPVQTGVSIVGNVITFDTDIKDEYQFTSLSLGAIKTLKGVGANPLTIRVQGTTVIDGTIDLNGVTGVVNTRTIGLISGAAGGAGGGRGGHAGFGTTNPGTAGTLGLPTSASVALGGSPGINILAVYGDSRGGGGGCNGKNLDAGDATAAPFTGGAAGACTSTRIAIANLFETTFIGGAGGGGGGGFIDQGTPASSVTGASGGGGGGALHLASTGAITISGTVSANGGTGGANNIDSAGDPSTCGGAGGGGSGGSIWFQTATSISSTGTVSVQKGAKGTSTAICGTDFDGGIGSLGTIRVDTPTGSIAGATVSKTLVIPAGFTVYSKAISTRYVYAALGAPTETIDTTSAGCGTDGTITITYEGSNDGATFEQSVTQTSISELNDYAFIRFKAVIQPTGSTPPCLAALSIPYGPRELTDLEIKGGLFCGTVRGGSPRDGGGDMMMIAFASLVALLNGSFLKKSRRFFRAPRTIAE